MEALLAALEGSALAEALRFSRWGYAAVNAAHILGIALLVGAILPLNLRLLGLWRSVAQGDLVRVLAPSAAVGLLLAAAAGVLLFSVKAGDYAALAVFQLKLGLIALGTFAALLAHWRHGLLLEGATRTRLAGHAAISIFCWLGALTCGRLIAFVGG
ncbi:MAG: DUF2214 domain-containing protein [Rhodovibrionaceae bacterium]